MTRDDAHIIKCKQLRQWGWFTYTAKPWFVSECEQGMDFLVPLLSRTARGKVSAKLSLTLKITALHSNQGS